MHKYYNISSSLEDFTLANQGTNREFLINQRIERQGQPGGPKLRYIRDPQNSDHVIDMRHLLVIGAKGPAFGNSVEIGQYLIPGNKSGLDPQDYYSNDLGYRFYEYLSQNKIDTNHFLFVNYLDTFLRTRKDP